MTKPKIIMVVAVARNYVIGNAGGMPWRLSTDLKRFKALTMGRPMIMGRKTFDSIGKPLPGRTSIVISRDKTWQSPGVVPVNSLEKAIELAMPLAENGEIAVVGGGEIYKQAMPLAHVLHVTHIEATPEGDTYFPQIDSDRWTKVSEEAFPVTPKDEAATRYAVYNRKS
ncbi:MAG: dihydrofolate reductase [Pseudomonadota bacterium]